MMPFKDVVEKYGGSIAADIKKKKLELEAQRQEHEEHWYTKHPEIDQEDN